MATNYLPLDEAAQRLGISHEKLVEMRSRGAIRGFRDGASWKFPADEIERIAADMVSGDLDPGLSDLISEQEVGSLVNQGPVLGGNAANDPDSDVGLGDESPAGGNTDMAGIGSDVQTVSNQSDDLLTSSSAAVMGVSDDLLAGGSAEDLMPVDDGDDLFMSDSGELTLSSPEDSGRLELADEIKEGSTNPTLGSDLADEKPSSKINSDLALESDPMEGHSSSLEMLGEDLELSAGESGSISGLGSSTGQDVLSELDLLASGGSGGTGDLIRGDSDPAVLGGSDIASGVNLAGSGLDFDDALNDDDELVIADDDDDLVLGGAGSDISIAGDSGINLMSPSDSGLSLESEPLDLAGSSISALDLGADLEGSGGPGSSGPRSGSGGSGSLVDFQADEDFQLSPSGIDIEVEEDSGSQVIEVEDSGTFGSGIDLVSGAIPGAGGMGDDPFGAEVVADEVIVDEMMDAEEIGVDETAAPAGATVVTRPAYETPYSLLSVISLVGILLVMSLGGMLMTDLMRNLWSYNEVATPVSSMTDALIEMFGLGP